MLMQMVKTECKTYLRSPIYYVFALIVLMFYFVQASPFNINKSLEPIKAEPKTYYSYVMYRETDIINKINININRIKSMGTVDKIGGIVTKTERLSKNQLELVLLKGTEINDILVKVNSGALNKGEALEKAYLSAENLDKALGGSTIFAKKNRNVLLTARDSYEESVKLFNNLIESKSLTDSAARSLADNLSIIAGFFPIFLAAFMLKREKKHQMEEIIYSRNFSDLKYISSKWIGLFIVTAAIFIIIAIHASVMFYLISMKQGYPFQPFSFVKYIVFWVLPTLGFVISLGLFISVLTEKRLLAVLLQLILWFLSILPLSGDYRLYKIFIRFNGINETAVYQRWFTDILVNRVFYVLLTLLLIAGSTLIFSRKRSCVNESNKFFFENNKI